MQSNLTGMGKLNFNLMNNILCVTTKKLLANTGYRQRKAKKKITLI